MNFFPKVEKWNLPWWIFDGSISEMAIDGRRGTEGVALWLGRRGQDVAEISQLVVLRGPGIVKEPDFLQISPALINEVTDKAIELGLSLIGQVHSHGEGYGTDLSLTDRRYGFLVPHYLSLVAPDYALRDRTAIADCGVHVFEPGTGYRRLPPTEVAHRVTIVDRPEGSPIIVEG